MPCFRCYIRVIVWMWQLRMWILACSVRWGRHGSLGHFPERTAIRGEGLQQETARVISEGGAEGGAEAGAGGTEYRALQEGPQVRFLSIGFMALAFLNGVVSLSPGHLESMGHKHCSLDSGVWSGTWIRSRRPKKLQLSCGGNWQACFTRVMHNVLLMAVLSAIRLLCHHQSLVPSPLSH